MNLDKHPLALVRDMIERDGLHDADFTFRKYVRLGSSGDAPEYRELGIATITGAQMIDSVIENVLAPAPSPQKYTFAVWARGVGAEIYLAGRASHAYVPKLLTQAEWLAFLGRVILDLSVDVRWIGHGLISGVHALRWTKNAKDYCRCRPNGSAEHEYM